MMLFVLPAIFILVLSIALQGAFSSIDSTENFEILVVNKDEGKVGDKIINALEDTGYFKAITSLDNNELVEESALKALHRGKYQVAVIVPEDASKAVSLETNAVVEILLDPVIAKSIATTIQSTVEKFVFLSVIDDLRDETDELVAKFEKLKRRNGKKDDKNDKVEYAGLKVDRKYTSSKGAEVYPNSVQQSVPGWTIFALFWIAQILALNIIDERVSGAYKRILISPVSLFTYLLGKMIPFFIVNMYQAVFMFSLGVFVLPVFGCPELQITNVLGLTVMTLAISFASISFGLFMASLSKSSIFVASACAAALIIMTVLGGIMVPKYIMPSIMRKMSLYVPHGWALDGYINILVKDYDTFQILPQVGMLFVFGLCFFIFSFIRLRKQQQVL